MTRRVEAPVAAQVWMVCPGGAEGRGGMGRHVRYLLRAWAQGGWRPALRVLDSYGPSQAAMPATFAAAAARLGLALLRRQVAILHLHMAADGSTTRKLLLARLGRAFGVPVVVHLHGSRFADFVRAMPAARRAALSARLRAVAAVLALGPVWRDLLVDELGLRPEQVHVLPNAVPALPVAVAAAGPCRILFLGRLGERKGTPELLRALARLRGHATPWTAVLAGDGELERFRAMATALGLAEHVALTGWVDEARAHALLGEASLLVLPSHNEGLPMAILEAMSCGLPVVATPVGAVPDAVQDGVNGLLVPVGDDAALAAAMARLLDDAALRRRMGAEARRLFDARYGMDQFCATLAALYARLVPGLAASAADRTGMAGPPPGGKTAAC